MGGTSILWKEKHFWNMQVSWMLTMRTICYKGQKKVGFEETTKTMLKNARMFRIPVQVLVSAVAIKTVLGLKQLASTASNTEWCGNKNWKNPWCISNWIISVEVGFFFFLFYFLTSGYGTVLRLAWEFYSHFLCLHLKNGAKLEKAQKQATKYERASGNAIQQETWRA